MNWLDIVMGGLFLINALRGFSRGLILSAFKLVGAIVALYVGIFYREMVVSFLKGFMPVEYVISKIFRLPDMATGSELVQVLGLATFIDMALGAVGFLFVFSLVSLVFLIPAYFIEGLVKLAALSPLNRGLGMVFGIARTGLIIMLVTSALSPFLMAWPGSWLETSVNTSYILSHLKYFDIITPLLVELI